MRYLAIAALALTACGTGRFYVGELVTNTPTSSEGGVTLEAAFDGHFLELTIHNASEAPVTLDWTQSAVTLADPWDREHVLVPLAFALERMGEVHGAGLSPYPAEPDVSLRPIAPERVPIADPLRVEAGGRVVVKLADRGGWMHACWSNDNGEDCSVRLVPIAQLVKREADQVRGATGTPWKVHVRYAPGEVRRTLEVEVTEVAVYAGRFCPLARVRFDHYCPIRGERIP
ncbi:MAG: hypothetical protein RIT81_10435 [Deltaproteobacteria bacterium]